jgi:hypothetical protein
MMQAPPTRSLHLTLRVRHRPSNSSQVRACSICHPEQQPEASADWAVVGVARLLSATLRVTRFADESSWTVV